MRLATERLDVSQIEGSSNLASTLFRYLGLEVLCISHFVSKGTLTLKT